MGPAGITELGEPLAFEATLIGKVTGLDVSYKWAASNGEIISGEGTTKVSVEWPDRCLNVTVTVYVSGLPATCPATASETVGVSHCKPSVRCPQVSITGPNGIFDTNEPISYVAAVDGSVEDFKPIFVWSVFNGEILEGQGTKNIAVRLTEVGRNLTVRLDVKGLPRECLSSASETISTHPPLVAKELDVFLGRLSTDEVKRINEIVDAAHLDDPTARIYIIISGSKRSPGRSIRQKKTVLADRLRIPRDFNPVTIVESNRNDDRLVIWRVPLGARPPTP